MLEEHTSTPPPPKYASTDLFAREEYRIPSIPPVITELQRAKVELQLNCSKVKTDDQKEPIGYYIVWSLVFFGIWMLLTFGKIFVALLLTALSVIIGSVVDSADRKKRKRDV
jgi:hypothetical protein